MPRRRPQFWTSLSAERSQPRVPPAWDLEATALGYCKGHWVLQQAYVLNQVALRPLVWSCSLTPELSLRGPDSSPWSPGMILAEEASLMLRCCASCPVFCHTGTRLAHLVLRI